MRILVVDDEKLLVKGLKFNLENEGYEVSVAYDGATAVDLARRESFDLILLDWMMPGMSGSDACMKIREFSDVPVVMLTARSEDADKVSALDLGANDYITKPFGTAELLARVRASLRIARHHIQSMGPDGRFILEDLTIDYDRRSVTVGTEYVHLTQTEYNILAFLSQHVGKVMTYTAIINAIWGSIDNGSVKKLQVNMANIRKKLGCRPGENKYIINELGVGYRMPDARE